jgi:hypothetical protein
MLLQLVSLFAYLALPVFLVLGARYGLPPIMLKFRRFWLRQSQAAPDQYPVSSSEPKKTVNGPISPRILHYPK